MSICVNTIINIVENNSVLWWTVIIALMKKSEKINVLKAILALRV
jgi:hypothetical protein